MVEFDFVGRVIHWRGPAPFFYVEIPERVGERIADLSRAVTYGWGMIPVDATIGGTTWTTSMFPRDGGYLLPVKAAVRKAESVELDATVEVTLRLRGT